MTGSGDTIAAIATPSGAGGVGVLRVSGPKVRDIAEAILHPPKPVPALRRAARRCRELFGVEWMARQVGA